MKSNNSKKVLIFMAVLLIISLSTAIYLGHILYKQIVNTNNKVEQVKFSTAEREKVFALRDSVDKTTEQRGILNQAFVGSSDLDTANFIDYIENLAKKSNLSYSVKSVAYEDKMGSLEFGNLKFIRIKMNVGGVWSSVFAFTRQIENLSKLTFINSVSFDQVGNKWSAEIDFVTLKLKN